MTSSLLKHCTFSDLFLIIFGLIVLVIAGTNVLWFFLLICVFILGKAYLRREGALSVCTVHGPPQDDDWDDDDDGIATGLYD